MSRPMAERSGHPEIPWTILLDATVAGEVSVGEVADRLRAAWPAWLGPPAEVAEGWPDLDALAATAFLEGPQCRLLVAPSRVVVVAHHGSLDGLGLVGVLGAAIGVDLGTTARGVDPSAARRSGRTGYGIRRLVEALVRPPARIAPAPGDGDGDGAGEHLVSATVDAVVDTPRLVAAAVRAVRRWNARSGARAEPVAVAVGAATRSGADPGIGRSAAWFRLRVADPSPEAVSTALRSASPEPEPSSGLMWAASRTGLSRAIAGRTGSTLLVSNLGGLVGSGSTEVVEAAFYPAAHGRSGVSIGAVGVGGRTVLTLRARRRDLSAERTTELLRSLAGEAERPGRG